MSHYGLRSKSTPKTSVPQALILITSGLLCTQRIAALHWILARPS